MPAYPQKGSAHRSRNPVQSAYYQAVLLCCPYKWHSVPHHISWHVRLLFLRCSHPGLSHGREYCCTVVFLRKVSDTYSQSYMQNVTYSFHIFCWSESLHRCVLLSSPQNLLPKRQAVFLLFRWGSYPDHQAHRLLLSFCCGISQTHQSTHHPARPSDRHPVFCQRTQTPPFSWILLQTLPHFRHRQAPVSVRPARSDLHLHPEQSCHRKPEYPDTAELPHP